MRVEEAKTKVCPFIAERGEDASGYTVFSKHIKCITNDCIAWIKNTEYEEIIKIVAADDDELEKAKIKRGVTKEHKVIEKKVRWLDTTLTYGIPIKEECGYCQRLKL